MAKTLFEQIVDNEIPSWKVWEDEKHLAFLTPFPNTPGLTVVIPKKNIGGYVFKLSDEEYRDLLCAVKIVVHILEKAFNTPRVALVFEGTGVDHVHAKLYPLHGELAGKTDVWSPYREFNEEYRGWLSTTEGPMMSDEELTAIQQKIIDVQK
jgi:histidine triad (HIT) family protein